MLDPMSKNPLKIKKLVDVHFTPIKDDDNGKSLITKDVSVVSKSNVQTLSQRQEGGPEITLLQETSTFSFTAKPLNIETIWFQARYVCAVTNDVLSNSVPCAVIKPS